MAPVMPTIAPRGRDPQQNAGFGTREEVGKPIHKTLKEHEKRLKVLESGHKVVPPGKMKEWIDWVHEKMQMYDLNWGIAGDNFDKVHDNHLKVASRVSAAESRVQQLETELEECREYMCSQGAKLRQQDTQLKAQANIIDELKNEIRQHKADQAAENKVRDDRLLRIEQAIGLRTDIPNNNGQQFPGPGPGPNQQQQQQQGPSNPGGPGGPSGNGLWTPSPSPPAQGSQSSQGGGDVHMDEVNNLELDSPMMDAPEEPYQPQPLQPQFAHQPQFVQQPAQFVQQPPQVVQQPPQVVQQPQFFQQPPQFVQQQPRVEHQPQFVQQPPPSVQQPPPSVQQPPQFVQQPPQFAEQQPQVVQQQPQVVQQPPQPSTAPACDDTPMGDDGPVACVSSNNGNGGFAPPSAPAAQPSAAFNSGMQPNVNPTQFTYNSPPPPVNKPQINWGAQVEEALSFDPPPVLSGNDGGLPPSVSKKSPTTAAPASLPTSQPAAPPATQVNGGSASNASPRPGITIRNNNGQSCFKVKVSPPTAATPTVGTPTGGTPNVGTPSTAATPSPKPAQKKKPNLFMPRKPAANPNKPAPVTSKAQTTQTAAASLAQKKQEAFRNAYTSTPPTPKPWMNPADEEVNSKTNPSPFATKPATPQNGGSSSATHDTVESDNAGNIFLKKIVEEPQAKPEAKPEDKTPSDFHEPEFNTRKHTAGQQGAPTSAEQQDDAMMDNGRKTLNPKGRAQKMPAHKFKEIIEDRNVEQAFGVWDFAKQATAATEAAPESPSQDGPASKMTGGQVQEQQQQQQQQQQHNPSDQGASEDPADREHAKKVLKLNPEIGRHTLKPKSRASKMTAEQIQAHKDAEAQAAAEAAEDRNRELEAARKLAEALASQDDKKGRHTLKPKSRASKMTAEQIQAHKDAEAQAAADAAEDRNRELEAARKLAEALASQDDKVDYGNPNDVNDEDTHTTVMPPATKSAKRNGYTVIYFLGWEEYVRKNAKSFAKVMGAPVTGEDINAHWLETLDDFDTKMWPLDKLVAWAGYDYDAAGYTRTQMLNLMSTWAQEVFEGALAKTVGDFRLGPVVEEAQLEEVHSQIMVTAKKWLSEHAPDVVI